MNRKYPFMTLLVIAVASLTLGLVVGGQLASPSLAANDRDWLRPPQEASVSVPPGAVDFASIAEKALPAVVGVQNTSIVKVPEDHPFGDDPFFRRFFGPAPERERRNIGFGSGFIISSDGYILTNNHVVQGATRITIEMIDGEKFEAETIGTDSSIDLALIKIDPDGRELPTLSLGDSEGVRVGEWVLAIGNPLGLDYTVTAGVVSAKARNFPIGETIPGVASFIQTDAAINRGNSGGPLLDAGGRVIGINTAIFRGMTFDNTLVEGVGFALPINVARDAVEQLLESGSVRRGYLGITMNQHPIDEDAKVYYGLPDTGGVLITEVQPGMPADRAGVRKDDVIIGVDGEKVEGNNDLLSKIATRRPGEKVNLEIFRKGKTLDLAVTLSSRDEGIAARSGRGRSRPEQPDEDEEVSSAVGLGIEVENLTPTLRDRLDLSNDVRGVVVTKVDASSMAAEKGISPRMIIASVNDRPIEDLSDWSRALRKLEVGDLVKIEIRSGDQSDFVILRAPETQE